MPQAFVDKAKQRGSLVWNALYQQRPTAKGGGLIKSEWFGEYRELPKLKWRAVYGDTAQKTKEVNDFSVFEHWGLGEDGYLYLIDMIRENGNLTSSSAELLRSGPSAKRLRMARYGISP
jgi:phage terminase large subunit-like protein